VSVSALRVVESAPFYEREIDLAIEDESHSLHGSIPYPDSFSSSLPSYFIRKYSEKGEVVLDPFCGSGTTALEAALLGRIAIAADANPIAILLARAKIDPCDITEVTLRLQSINLRRPFDLRLYREQFSSFYDVDTFRELVNLRQALLEQPDRVSRFIQAVTLSILHGHSAGHLSAYSFPQFSLLPDEQDALNRKRNQVPDYRAVVARILRKSASMLRDGVPSILQQLARKHRALRADVRDLGMVPSASVDLVVTAPPLPVQLIKPAHWWLRAWFAGASLAEIQAASEVASLQSWSQFMNESLFEIARVMKRGARCVFDLREIRLEDQSVQLDAELSQMIEADLSRFWEPEGVLVSKPHEVKLKDSLRERNYTGIGRANRILVLRRR
jgi:SAM-dependent methyltransferase